MELETLKKANLLNDKLRKLVKSKETLIYFTKDKEDIALQIYIGKCSDSFVVPNILARGLIDYLFNLLEDKIKELEQELKEL